MPILSKTSHIFATLFFLISPVTMLADEAIEGVRAVAESERSFAHSAIVSGIRASFLQFFADDSIVFTPAPTSGKAFYAKYDDKGRQLIWEPRFATASHAGDLGVTAGPWELRKSSVDQSSLAFGEFVSIWKKQPDNSWKVLLDVGIEHARPNEAPAAIQLSPPSEKPGLEGDLRKTWETANKKFAEASQADAGQALLHTAGNEVRIFRDESFPSVGKEAGRKMLQGNDAKITREISGKGISASADLAYVYGSYSSQHGATAEKGYYLTIWRTNGNGDWEIILDLQKKTPETEKK